MSARRTTYYPQIKKLAFLIKIVHTDFMDSSDFFEAYKDKIGERLTRKLVTALEEKKISLDELSEISTYILDNIDKAKNNADLLDFTEHLSQKWPLFADLVSVEESEVKENSKGEKVEQVEELIGQNKIDEALKLATDANVQIQGGSS